MMLTSSMNTVAPPSISAALTDISWFPQGYSKEIPWELIYEAGFQQNHCSGDSIFCFGSFEFSEAMWELFAL